MSTGHKATVRGVSASALRQSKGGTSVSGGRIVDRWIKEFDVKQTNFDSRHEKLLNKLGAAKDFSSSAKK